MQDKHAPPLPKDRTAVLGGFPLAEALVLLVAAVYAPSLWGRFLWDDAVLLFNNPGQLSPLRDIWMGRGGFDYFPLTQTLFWAEARIWDLDVRGYHAVNIALHVAAVVLLWRVLSRLRIPGAWLGALIFAIHPLCVESVAWIAEGKNTLSLALYAAALLVYLRFEERPQVRSYALALGLFLLALLAKTSAVMLPFVLLLCAWWQRGRITRQELIRSLPFFAASLILGVVTVRIQAGHIASGPPADYGNLWQRILQAGQFFEFYLGKAVLPYGLMTLYPRFTPLGIWPGVALAVAGATLWMFRRTAWGRGLCFALAYYALSIAPALGFFKMAFWVYAPVADRLQYFALIGIAALAGAAISAAPWKLTTRAAAGAVLCGALAGSAVSQQRGYRSPVALWSRQLEWTPSSVRTLDMLGGALVKEERYAEAVDYLETAAAIDPIDAIVRGDLGAAFVGVGRLDEGVIELEQAHRQRPDSVIILNNLGAAFAHQNRLEEAAAAYGESIRRHPENAESHDQLGLVLFDQGKFKEAVEEFLKSLTLDARRTDAQEHLEETLRRIRGN